MLYTLMTPGPVPLPPEVLQSLAQPMEHHRTPEFLAVFQRVLTRLKQVYATTQPVFIHTSTGSGGMESALVNTLSPGDEIISIISGKFGERWAEMAEVFGIKVHRLEIPWGQAVRLDHVKDIMQRFPNSKAVLCQACETSTGVLHPIKEIAAFIRTTPALFIVDAITALGAMPMPMDEWGIDVLIGGSQKAFMLPTGLAFISFSKKAWALVETARCPHFYFDVRAEKRANENGESVFSTAVMHIRALDVVLEQVQRHGLISLFARIQTLASATRNAVTAMGFEIFPQSPSPSVTAIRVPGSIDGQKVRTDMEKSHHIIVMGGQDQLKGKIIRIGHMGAITNADCLATLRALAASVNSLMPGFVTDIKLEQALKQARAELQ